MELDAETKAAIERARHFFEHDYKDRGMVKWQGYYLSDHTEDVQKYSKQRNKVEHQAIMPEMATEEITQILFYAYANHKVIQLQTIDKDVVGHVAPIIESKVQGYTENDVVLDKCQVNIESIHWCQLIN